MNIQIFKILLYAMLGLISLAVSSDIEIENEYRLITTDKEFTAGTTIELEFSFTGSPDVYLYCSNSYGSLLLQPFIDKNSIRFLIPKTFSNKSGILNWKLNSKAEPLIGQLKILPKSDVQSIESYLGPPSIQAGGSDYTMLVVIPTDEFDNPLEDSTEVYVKHQFLSRIDTSSVYTEHGFGYKNIYSQRQDGRIIISSQCFELNSKEFDVNVMPAIPTDFSINFKRIHNYADGNQIVTFKTSVIKDQYDNIVSDGTLVTFFITDKNGFKSKFSGSTINGIATAHNIHPDHENQWIVKAYVEGMANSNDLVLNFEQAVSEFDVQFSKDKRTITVGPLRSFMSQRVPDGLLVKLSIFKDGELLDEIINSSLKGITKFYLKSDRYSNGTYDLIINAAGITKTISDLSYD